MQLVIGTKKWSSWSLRPWLALKRSSIEFTEDVIPLRRHGVSEAAIRAAGSPTGMVPFLKDGPVVVWDSLAICEYIAEKSSIPLWPEDARLRAMARAAAAETHAGFHSLRGECPMDLSKPAAAVTLSEATHVDIRRVVQLWSDCRAMGEGAGDFLFGSWSIADAFFTPVATRFRTYGVRLSDFGDRGDAGRYAEALLETAEFRDWEASAAQE
jgi:glutathione S-transferase